MSFVIYKSLNYFYSRRLMEEDDNALSEIEPDSVPNEVRDWLAMTFTRSMSTVKRRLSDKPKFKSVAQAIRAGIMVDRLVICSSILLPKKYISLMFEQRIYLFFQLQLAFFK
jgi:hypothetical protein